VGFANSARTARELERGKEKNKEKRGALTVSENLFVSAIALIAAEGITNTR